MLLGLNHAYINETTLPVDYSPVFNPFFSFTSIHTSSFSANECAFVF